MVKNLHANAGDTREVSLIPGSERFPGEEHGTPLQYSCLENPMNRGTWQFTVHGATKSQTRLKHLSTQGNMTIAMLSPKVLSRLRIYSLPIK